MNSWHGFRRGYFGTYLYDVPEQNDLRVLAVDGKPLPEATITIYQKITTPSGQETIPNQAKFTGTTDANGIYGLPNVNINTAGFVKTETGNIPRPNPFGYISLLGDNGVFLIKIEKEGFCDYQWIDITRFNIAYWQGNTIAATYDIPTNVFTDFELSLPPDLAESSASGWSAASSDAASSNVVTFDTDRKLFGQNSLKLETTSGFDVWLRYPKNKLARWDLTQKDSLRVWFYAENPSPAGFQNNSPWIRLYNGKSGGGYIEYHATSELLNPARSRWQYYAIPLTGNATWQRTDQGNVGLSEINYLEIHADTWDYGFTLWVDGVGFDPRVGPGRALFIPDTSAAPGDTIDIPIRITDASGVAGAQFAVTYNPKILTALSAQTTALTKGFLLADSVSIGKITIAMARDTSIASGSGSLVNLTFVVNPTAAPGETAKLAFTKLSLFDDRTMPVSATPVNGVFTVGGIKSIQILPDSAVFFIKLRGEQVFQVQGLDVNDKPVAVNASWSVDPAGLGSFNPIKGDSTTFTAQSLGDGIVTAQLGAISTTVDVIVGLLGDISKDFIVDARDAFVCLRMIAGLDLPPIPPGHKTPTAYEKWAADFNEDKVINSADALLILRQSLGRLQAAPKILAGNEEAVLRLPRIEALAGQIVTVPILVEERREVYAADFSLSYDPTALTLLGVTPGDTAALMAVNTQELGKIKLAMIAAGGLVGKNGELVKLQFKLQRAYKNESAVAMASFNLFDAQANGIQARVETGATEEAALPQSYNLLQNYPNPFLNEAKFHLAGNPATTIRYQLPKESSVKLQIYDLRGYVVRTLVNAKMKAGEATTAWDGKDEAGDRVPSGVYFYRLQVNGGEWASTRRMMVVR
jgi:Cohesin domain/FlgD Ig-like domain/Dockerin type I domain